MSRAAQKMLMRAAEAAIGRSRRVLSLGQMGIFFAEGGGEGGGAGGAGAGAGGAAGAGAAGGAVGGDPKPAEPVVPKAEADRAFKARDAAKKQFKAVIKAAGYDPDSVKLTENKDDPDNPWHVEIDGEDKTAEFFGRFKPADNKPASGQKALSELENQWKNRLKIANDKGAAREAALVNSLSDVSVIGPLQTAFLAEKAIPETMADLIELAKPFIRMELAKDDDGNIVIDDRGRVKIKTTPIGADGNPMTDASGNPVTLAAFAKKFLETRKHFVGQSRPGGPGAGGAGNSGGQPQKQTPAEMGARAARQIFGMPEVGNGNGSR